MLKMTTLKWYRTKLFAVDISKTYLENAVYIKGLKKLLHAPKEFKAIDTRGAHGRSVAVLL